MNALANHLTSRSYHVDYKVITSLKRVEKKSLIFMQCKNLFFNQYNPPVGYFFAGSFGTTTFGRLFLSVILPAAYFWYPETLRKISPHSKSCGGTSSAPTKAIASTDIFLFFIIPPNQKKRNAKQENSRKRGDTNVDPICCNKLFNHCCDL